jgi:hypothetical protein
LGVGSEIFKRAAARVRSFIRTNFTGGADFSYNGPKAEKPQSAEEKLQAAMENTEVMPPELFTKDDHINRKFVEFFVKKLIDLVESGLAAGCTWLFFKMTGHRIFSEAEARQRELAETIAPVAMWAACFLGLTYRRLFHARKGQ